MPFLEDYDALFTFNSDTIEMPITEPSATVPTVLASDCHSSTISLDYTTSTIESNNMLLLKDSMPDMDLVSWTET